MDKIHRATTKAAYLSHACYFSSTFICSLVPSYYSYRNTFTRQITCAFFFVLCVYLSLSLNDTKIKEKSSKKKQTKNEMNWNETTTCFIHIFPIVWQRKQHSGISIVIQFTYTMYMFCIFQRLERKVMTWTHTETKHYCTHGLFSAFS